MAQPYVDSGELVVLGVIQEQHAERCVLYAQWKQFKWPIVQDATTHLNLDAVPLIRFVDEHGVVRNTRPRTQQLKEFVKTKFDAPEPSGSESKSDSNQDSKPVSAEKMSVDQLVEKGETHLLWRKSSSEISDAIKHFEMAVKANPKNPKLCFYLGVAYRTRFDSDQSQPEDFDRAFENWTAALKANPNQYIWRRRLEQYGPRMEKPYPFYSWVEQAVKEIKERGEVPVKLNVDLTASELAQRAQFSPDKDKTNPDSENKITADSGLIRLRTTVVPGVATIMRSRTRQPKTMRVYLRMTPSGGKWNNESQPLKVWINEESDGRTSKRLLEFPNPPTAESEETRVVEFEFEPKSDDATVSGYALYNVCETESGQCLYRRQDFEIDMPALK